MNEVKFIDGIRVSKPHENAPGFVKAGLSFHIPRLIEWANQQTEEWVNSDLKESKQGKLYLAVNDYQPKQTEQAVETTGFNPPHNAPVAEDQDLPF